MDYVSGLNICINLPVREVTDVAYGRLVHLCNSLYTLVYILVKLCAAIVCRNKALAICTMASRVGGILCPFVLTLVCFRCLNLNVVISF